MTVQVEINDNHDFWFHNESINQIISELVEKGSVAVSFNTEGPCAKSMGLYEFFENISSNLNIPHNNIEIRTHNQVEYHPTFKITKLPLAHSLPTVQNELFFDNTKHTKKFNNEQFKKVACFVGRNSWDRLWISSKLYKDYKEESIQTYHLDTNDKKFIEKSILGVDTIIKTSTNIDTAKNTLDFLTECPLDGPDDINEYPITVDSNLNIDSEYHRFFLEVACETYIKGNTFFPTEKTWRPIALKTPFVVNGPVGFLKNLKRLGFKTFDRWWDESYDYNGHEARIEKIFKIIDYISTLSISELNTMYNEMQDVLEHNYQTLYKLTPDDFKKAFHY